mmetsp:Transcript_39776/g.86044  ORF Transcript_39776/g.86044 Transcript_39776/m.86044 type:complete len:314 (-) Transcript_39776:34-975(-)
MKGQLRRRYLRQLATLLQRMDLSTRREAITNMPTNSRAALLEFMTQVNGCGLSIKVTPAERKRSKPVKAPKTTQKRRRNSSHGGIRAVRPGAFQAQICFSRLLVRSRTTRCAAQADQFHAVLLRMCQLVTSGTFDEDVPLEERIRSARQTAMVELGLAEREMRLCYATVVSSGSLAGSIESPTTPSLSQALSWRQRLGLARDHGWSELRSVWLEVLHERSKRCERSGVLGKAVKRVDAAWQKHAEGRLRLSLRREAQHQQRQQRERCMRCMLERRRAAAKEQLQVMLEDCVLKLEGLLTQTAHHQKRLRRAQE